MRTGRSDAAARQLLLRVQVQRKVNAVRQTGREGNCLSCLQKSARLRGLNQSGSDKERVNARRVSAAWSGPIGAAIVSHQSFPINSNTTTQAVRIFTPALKLEPKDGGGG